MDEFNSTSSYRRVVFFGVLVAVAMVAAPVMCLGAVADGSPARSANLVGPLPNANQALTAESQAPSCDRAIENADFRASFDWNNGASANPTPMEIRVGSSGAQIFETGSKHPQCVAVCTLKASADRKVASLAYPAAIDMDCQAAGFTGLSSPAALVFSASAGQKSVLRFGNWVSGYHDATLAIGVDHLSTKAGS